MTVVKLNSSGRSVQIITDEGHVYQVTASALTFLLNGHAKAGFIPTVRMPFNAAPGRYKPSEVWTNGGKIDPNAVTNTGKPGDTVTTRNDAFSPKVKAANKQAKAYSDVHIDI